MKMNTNERENLQCRLLFATGFKTCGTGPLRSTKFIGEQFAEQKEWWSLGRISANGNLVIRAEETDRLTDTES